MMLSKATINICLNLLSQVNFRLLERDKQNEFVIDKMIFDAIKARDELLKALEQTESKQEIKPDAVCNTCTGIDDPKPDGRHNELWSNPKR